MVGKYMILAVGKILVLRIKRYKGLFLEMSIIRI